MFNRFLDWCTDNPKCTFRIRATLAVATIVVSIVANLIVFRPTFLILWLFFSFFWAAVLIRQLFFADGRKKKKKNDESHIDTTRLEVSVDDFNQRSELFYDYITLKNGEPVRVRVRKEKNSTIDFRDDETSPLEEGFRDSWVKESYDRYVQDLLDGKVEN